MENIIKKAIEGGYSDTIRLSLGAPPHLVTLDPLFWQALGKACGWAMTIFETGNNLGAKIGKIHWMRYALDFHEINLTEGWSAAVTYLQEVTK